MKSDSGDEINHQVVYILGRNPRDNECDMWGTQVAQQPRCPSIDDSPVGG